MPSLWAVRVCVLPQDLPDGNTAGAIGGREGLGFQPPTSFFLKIHWKSAPASRWVWLALCQGSNGWNL